MDRRIAGLAGLGVLAVLVVGFLLLKDRVPALAVASQVALGLVAVGATLWAFLTRRGRAADPNDGGHFVDGQWRDDTPDFQGDGSQERLVDDILAAREAVATALKRNKGDDR